MMISGTGKGIYGQVRPWFGSFLNMIIYLIFKFDYFVSFESENAPLNFVILKKKKKSTPWRRGGTRFIKLGSSV